MTIRFASYSDIGGRACNEDTVKIHPTQDAVLAVVADGLGGHGNGDLASAEAARVICESWNGEIDPGGLAECMQKAHRAVQALQENGRYAMKTTAVVLAADRICAAWAHAGDTRMYHFINGSLHIQTRDHSASQVAVMLGNITADQIRFHEDRSRVLRALGQDGELKIESALTALEPGKVHAFLLCTDGFWEYVLENEMEKDLADAESPEDWLNAMRARLAERISEGNDDNSAAVLWLET